MPIPTNYEFPKCAYDPRKTVIAILPHEQMPLDGHALGDLT